MLGFRNGHLTSCIKISTIDRSWSSYWGIKRGSILTNGDTRQRWVYTCRITNNNVEETMLYTTMHHSFTPHGSVLGRHKFFETDIWGLVKLEEERERERFPIVIIIMIFMEIKFVSFFIFFLTFAYQWKGIKGCPLFTCRTMNKQLLYISISWWMCPLNQLSMATLYLIPHPICLCLFSCFLSLNPSRL